MDASNLSRVADRTDESRWAIGISGDLVRHAGAIVRRQRPEKKRPLICCCSREDIEVYWIETPVILWGRSRMDKLRGFVQRAVIAKGEPRAADIAGLLHLPLRVVELVLKGLEEAGALSSDSGGRWCAQDGVAIMGTAEGPPTLKEETRRLLCYWPAADVLLPALPQSLRHRDLALLPDHELKGEFLDAYERIRSWKDQDAIHRGKLESLELPPPPPPSRPRAPSPSVTRPDGTVIGSETTRPLPPHRPDSVHVKRSRLDLICLTWAQLERESGVWNVESRFWSRLRGTEYDDESAQFACGDSIGGLPLLETIIEHGMPSARGSVDRLRVLFEPSREDWRGLLAPGPLSGSVRHRAVDDPDGSLLVNPAPDTQGARWSLLDTTLGGHLKIVCRNVQGR